MIGVLDAWKFSGEMQSNSRFAVAIHVLALARVALEEENGVAITSERMAESVKAHPVHVRRVLGGLREAGLVTSQPGPGGGWRLTRPPETISLCDIYRAVEHEPLFALPKPSQEGECTVGQCLPAILTTCFQDAEAAIEERLGRLTLADIIGAVRAKMEQISDSPREVRQPLVI